MKRTILSVVLTGMFLLAAPVYAEAGQATATQVSYKAADPVAQLQEMTQLLRRNDIAGLVRVAMPPEQLQMVKGAFEVQRNKPITDEERAEFERGISKLIAPNAVDQVMAEIEPKLIEARPQAEGAIMMGLGAAQMALNSPESELTPQQREMLRAALPGLQQWLTSTDFFNAETARQAVTLVVNALRSTGVSNLDQMRMLSFEEVLGHSGNVWAASKRALRLYGLDLDTILGSTRYELLANDGQTATIRATVTVFEAPLSRDFEMVQRGGRWYGKDAIIRFGKEAAQAEGEAKIEVKVAKG